MKLSLHLVTWNGARWLPGLFESLRKMDFRLQPSDFSLLVLDNGSTDGTAEMLKKELPTLPFPYQLIEGKENVGFAAGHNTLFEIREKRYERDDSGYVLIFNQDLFFEPDCIGKLVHFLNAHPDAAAVAPRLMRILALPARGRDPARLASKRAQGGGDNQPSALIDSLGLKKYRTWKVADIAAGHVWKPTAESPASPKTASRGGRQPRAVFGISGACAMFRVSALRRVAFPDGTIFDASYGSYKEDVDLAFRLKAVSYVLPDAVAYHARGSGNGKKDQSFTLRYQSYRNHLATIFTYFSLRDILDLPFVVCYEAGKAAWYLFRDPKVLLAWKEVWHMRRKLEEKRKWCRKHIGR